MVSEGGVSDCEGDNCAAYLEGLSVLFLHRESILQEDQSAELGLIIFDIDAIWLILDNCMRTGHRDIIDTDFTLMPSTHVIGELVWSEAKDVDGTGGVLFQWQGLHN